MKFMCLVIVDTAIGNSMSQSDWDAISIESVRVDKALKEKGILLAAEALESSSTARTVRVRSGKASITDGPFAETKEQVAGFILVEARDVAHALDIAAEIPLARIGAVEVRPVMNFRDT